MLRLLLPVLTILPVSLLAQTPFSIQKDAVLSAFQQSLPADWKMQVKQDTLIIRYQKTGYVIAGIYRTDSLNYALASKEFRQASQLSKPVPSKYNKDGINPGNTVQPELRYQLSALLSSAQVSQAVRNNQQIQEKQAALVKKYNGKPSATCNWCYCTSFANADNRKKCITEHYQLDTATVKLPDFHSSSYSLFSLNPKNIQPPYYGYYPASLDSSYRKVLQMIGDRFVTY
jgi:hypothetical protein